MELLFAYGLLRGEFETPVTPLVNAYTRPLAGATLPAQLYDLGGYPGVVPANIDNQRVLGQVFEVLDPDALWPELDAFEGISEQHTRPYEYRRELSEVTLDDGKRVNAWVYWYNGSVADKLRICSGDYLQRVASGVAYGR